MDKISHLLANFSIRAGVFFAGNLCGQHAFEKDQWRGHLHLIRRGPVELIGLEARTIKVSEPTLLFMPRPESHRLISNESVGADIVCGSIQFGSGGGNPMTDALPSLIELKISEITGIDSVLEQIFFEAFADEDGRQALLDRLCEVLIIRLLRHCIVKGIAASGTLAGLSDPKLSKTLLAIQADPARPWDLKELAQTAGMSRARFAAHFREVIGETSGEYLASWRIMLAQKMLLNGKRLKYVVEDVGYSSASALSRAFTHKLGCAPTEWLKNQPQRQETNL
jgi:AraC-like DNA-binding protein